MRSAKVYLKNESKRKIFSYFICFLTFFSPSIVTAKVADSIGHVKSNVGNENLKKYTNCYDINWAAWSNFTGKSSTGTINNGSEVIDVVMNTNYDFSSTPGIYNHAKFNNYPSPIPNTTVPQTTWSAGNGGTTTMCFSKTVSNPVLLIASLGNSAGLRATLKFSLPYVVLFDGGKMTFDNSTTITGEEGFAIIMFPGDFTCVTINSTTPEFYTNITWGIKPSPFIVNLTEDQSSCGIAKLTASGGVAYKWNGGDTPNNATNTFHQSGTYIVTVKDVNGCSASISKHINLPLFNPIISGITTSCGPITLTASGGTSYLWDGGNTPNNAINTFQTSGRYTVTIKNQQDCVSTLYIDISINPITGDDIISTPQTLFCNRESTIAITGSIPQEASSSDISYKWEQSNDGINWNTINNERAKDIVLSNLSETAYFRRTTYSYSCSSLSNVLKIAVNPLSTIANAGENLNLCGESSIILNGNKPGDNEVGTWSVISPVNFNPFTSTNIHDQNAVINNLPTGQQVVLQWEITNNNCNTTTRDEVEIISYRDILVTAPNKLTIDYGKVVNLNVFTDLGDEPHNFEWIPKTGLKNPFSLSPEASPRENTTYTLKINYGLNCSKTIPIEVIVLNTIEIPKSFSPNGDGINDTWSIGNILNYPGSKITIYNRYGTLIYQNAGNLAEWDGTYKGQLVPVGVYYYVIKLKDRYNSVHKGSITVIR
jgi:gliding motility-associated-like protein